MTIAHLVACPSCSRHVRVSDTTCPFCSEVIPEATRASEPRRAPAERLSRAALYAFGVGSLTVATACSSGPSSPAPQPFYGAAPFDAGPDDAAAQSDASRSDAKDDSPTVMPAYGISPPHEDGGHGVTPAYGISPEHDAGGGGQPVYGAPAYGGHFVPDGG